MNTWFWWCQRIIKQGCVQDYFNKHSKVKHCFKINTRWLQQTSIASRLIQDQAFASKQSVSRDQGYGNWLPSNVIDYQKTILKNNF